jgi:hypothetical protein
VKKLWFWHSERDAVMRRPHRHFFTTSLRADAYSGVKSEVFLMAIQEYVRSIAATQTVSKEEVFRFLEMQFARADRNHDGLLDIDELALFAQSVSYPESDQR